MEKIQGYFHHTLEYAPYTSQFSVISNRIFSCCLYHKKNKFGAVQVCEKSNLVGNEEAYNGSAEVGI